MTMKLWLIGWGALALLAVAAPGLVVLGMFLLLPGLILLAAPTVFAYSAVFALLRRYLPVTPGLVRNAAAAAIALLLGWLAALPWAIKERKAFERENLAEVVPASPVALAGHVRLEMVGRIPGKGKAVECGALCAALLDTTGVETVTVAAGEGGSLTFRLVPRGGDRSRGIYPVKPEAILSELPTEQEGRQKAAMRLAERKRDEQAVAAAWGLRLASRQKMVAERATTKADLTIRVVDDRKHRNEVSILRVEIVNNNGTALLRRSLVTGSALAAPLRFDGSGSMENFRIQLARDRLRFGSEYPGLKPVTELFLHSTLARPEVDDGAVSALLGRFENAAGNRALAGDDPDLGLVDLWLPTIDWQRRIPARQLSVLGRVIADERMPLPQKLYDGYESRVAPELRGALGSRILMASTPAQMRTRLAKLLSKMPEGTFATLSSDEKAILGSAELRPEVYPMIVRMADQGKAALPGLLDILRKDSLEPTSRRIWVMRAVSLAFATLGSEADAAIPEVDALVNAARSPLLHDYGDRKRWYLALARMGKPIDEFPWNNDKAEAVARNRAELRRRVERFDPKEAWNY